MHSQNQITDWKVPMPMDGWRRGGAPIALAPEITLPKPGPRVFLDYSKNDEWAVGMIAHELLSQDEEPFPDMEHPASYSDAVLQQASIPERCRPLVSGLLKVSLRERLDATQGVREARALQLPAAVSEGVPPAAQP